jgi:uncharacterized protein YoxC
MLEQRAMTIHEGITLARSTGAKAKKEMQETNYGNAKSTLDSQLAGLGETEKKCSEMIDDAKKIEETVDESRKSIGNLERAVTTMDAQNKELKRKIDELMTMTRNSQTSQSARDFEDDLATYIYPRGTHVMHGPKLDNLMIWLDTSGGEEANSRWNALKNRFGWNDKHKVVLRKMLDCRLKFEQERIDFEATFNNEERECRDNILRMHRYIKSISS